MWDAAKDPSMSGVNQHVGGEYDRDFEIYRLDQEYDQRMEEYRWKDSFDGINDATGHTADPPIALCEVQEERRRCWPAPNWPTRSANPGRRRGCASAPRCCRRGSSTRSGCPSRAGMRSRWTVANALSTR
jgi:hypothetical protein